MGDKMTGSILSVFFQGRQELFPVQVLHLAVEVLAVLADAEADRVADDAVVAVNVLLHRIVLPTVRTASRTQEQLHGQHGVAQPVRFELLLRLLQLLRLLVILRPRPFRRVSRHLR